MKLLWTMWITTFSVLVALTLGPSLRTAYADEGGDGDSDSSAAAPKEDTPAPPKKKGTQRAREKETEGTEAADRFQADTVLKSKYRVNGQQLEVDPD
jgi:hypothetical protein